MNFKHIKAGDTVTRMLAGQIPIQLTVLEVTEQRIIAGAWEFDRETGAEIDDELDWGPPPRMTGSYLKP